MGWLQYTLAILVFNGIGVLAVYALQRLQLWLPLNPQGMAKVSPDSSFNTAISFVTNTNWQGYGGETTMSYLTQMLGLGGAELLVGRHRHRGRRRADPRLRARTAPRAIGNFWVDLTRVTLYILLPLSFVFALVARAARAWSRTSSAYKDVHDARGRRPTRSRRTAPTASR